MSSLLKKLERQQRWERFYSDLANASWRCKEGREQDLKTAETYRRLAIAIQAEIDRRYSRA